MRKKNPIDALFPKIRQNILAATYNQPEKWWFMSELASFIETAPSSLQRELNTLVESGILRSRRDGRSGRWAAAPGHSTGVLPARQLAGPVGMVGLRGRFTTIAVSAPRPEEPSR